MAKKSQTKAAAPKAAALTADQFAELTPAQQQEFLASLQKENSALKAAATAKGHTPLPTFDVEADPENDIEGGEYQFTFPTFTWKEGKVINAAELIAEAGGSDAKKAEAAQAILAELVRRKSVYPKMKGE